VSIESGDRESGRDWDWELERGVEMVGVDVILVNFVAIARCWRRGKGGCRVWC
jgi:hypothetical protein